MVVSHLGRFVRVLGRVGRNSKTPPQTCSQALWGRPQLSTEHGVGHQVKPHCVKWRWVGGVGSLGRVSHGSFCGDELATWGMFRVSWGRKSTSVIVCQLLETGCPPPGLAQSPDSMGTPAPVKASQGIPDFCPTGCLLMCLPAWLSGTPETSVL